MEVPKLSIDQLRIHYVKHEEAKTEYEKKIANIMEERQNEMERMQQALVEANDNLNKVSKSHVTKISELQEAHELNLKETLGKERANFDRILEDLRQKHVIELNIKDEQHITSTKTSENSIKELKENMKIVRKRHEETLWQLQNTMIELEKSMDKLNSPQDHDHSKAMDNLKLKYDEVIRKLHSTKPRVVSSFKEQEIDSRYYEGKNESDDIEELKSEIRELRKELLGIKTGNSATKNYNEEEYILNLNSIEEEMEKFLVLCQDELRQGELELERRKILWNKEKVQGEVQINELETKIERFGYTSIANIMEKDEVIKNLNADLDASKLEITELTAEILELKKESGESNVELALKPVRNNEEKDKSISNRDSGEKYSNGQHRMGTEDHQELGELKVRLTELQSWLKRAESDTMYRFFVEKRYKKHTVIKEKTIRVDDSKKIEEQNLIIQKLKDEIRRAEEKAKNTNKQLSDVQESHRRTLAKISSLMVDTEKDRKDIDEKVQSEIPINVLEAKIENFVSTFNANRLEKDKVIEKLNADLDASKLEITESKAEILELHKEIGEQHRLRTEEQQELAELKIRLKELQSQLTDEESDTLYSFFVERRFKKHTIIREKMVRVDDSEKIEEKNIEIQKLEDEIRNAEDKANNTNKQLVDLQESHRRTLAKITSLVLETEKQRKDIDMYKGELAQIASLNAEIQKLKNENKKLSNIHTILVERKFQKHTVIKEKIVRKDPNKTFN